MKHSFLSALMLIVLGISTMSAKAETLTVTSSSNSGISQANCIGTLSDGTTLGFHFYSSNSSASAFCGAIGSTNSIEVPDKIAYNNKEYTFYQKGEYKIAIGKVVNWWNGYEPGGVIIAIKSDLLVAPIE